MKLFYIMKMMPAEKYIKHFIKLLVIKSGKMVIYCTYEHTQPKILSLATG